MSSASLGRASADLISPLTTLRNTLLQPESASTVPGTTLPKLLSSRHQERLRTPWQPFGPSSGSSTSKATARTVTIPGTSATFEVDLELAKLAEHLSKRAEIGIDEAAVLCKSYELHSLDDERSSADDGRIARILAWWSEESIAVAEISTAALLLGSGTEEQDWGDLAASLKETLMAEPEKWIEGLFRAFSGLAQTPLSGSQRSEYPLFW